MGFPPVSGGSGGLTQIFSSTLAVAAASIDTGALGIPAGHGTLICYFVGQDTNAGAAVNANINVNNDSGTNYDMLEFHGNNATPTSSNNIAQAHWNPVIHGAGGTAGYPGVLILTIPGYDQAVFNKVGTCEFAVPDGTGANQWSGRWAVGWRNTAAITRIAFASVANTFLAGSSLTIFGTK